MRCASCGRSFRNGAGVRRREASTGKGGCGSRGKRVRPHFIGVRRLRGGAGGRAAADRESLVAALALAAARVLIGSGWGLWCGYSPDHISHGLGKKLARGTGWVGGPMWQWLRTVLVCVG
jgi:hypothetical protein